VYFGFKKWVICGFLMGNGPEKKKKKNLDPMFQKQKKKKKTKKKQTQARPRVRAPPHAMRRPRMRRRGVPRGCRGKTQKIAQKMAKNGAKWAKMEQNSTKIAKIALKSH
jgi:hypothetical protein